MVWCFLQNPTWTQQSFLEGLNFHWFPRGYVRIPTPKYLNYKMFWTNMPCEVGLGVFQSALMKNMLLNTLHGIHKSTCQLYRSISVFMSYRVLWCTLIQMNPCQQFEILDNEVDQRKSDPMKFKIVYPRMQWSSRMLKQCISSYKHTFFTSINLLLPCSPAKLTLCAC